MLEVVEVGTSGVDYVTVLCHVPWAQGEGILGLERGVVLSLPEVC